MVTLLKKDASIEKFLYRSTVKTVLRFRSGFWVSSRLLGSSSILVGSLYTTYLGNCKLITAVVSKLISASGKLLCKADLS